jgi:Xaa-Pro aminopeptidase
MGPDCVALLVGARLTTRSNDTEFPFRQDSDFWYLTGFDQPDAVAVFRTDGGPTFTLFVQPREPETEIWTGYRPGVEGAKADYAADEAHPRDDLTRELPGIVEKARRIHHILGRDAALDERLIGVLEDMRRRSRLGLSPASEIVDPRSVIHEMRLFKSEEELVHMRHAAEISREAHAEAARAAQAGAYEYELEAVLNYTFRRRGSSGPAYSTIVGGGKNATVLHYIRNDCALEKGDLVLIDSGAEVAGYASDVTRTYPVGGRFEGAKRAVYEVVLAAQEAGLAECRPGNTLDSIHETTVRTLIDGMLSLGLLHGSVDDLIANEAHRAYYMHRTSHWLGLDVHDCGSYTTPGAPSTPRPLEAGMVFTVEPGIYIAPDAEDAPARLRGIGVRIEDDVVVSESGIENLNSAIPKRIDDLQALVRG